MHKLLSLLVASLSIALTFGASAQTTTPATSTAQPSAQKAPFVANTDKAPNAEPSKAHKKGKKKKRADGARESAEFVASSNENAIGTEVLAADKQVEAIPELVE